MLINLHAVVLCGGQSQRMGTDKSALDFHGESMLARVVRLLSTEFAFDRITCVAGIRQSLPTIPSDVRVIRDREENLGPLEGLTAGLIATSEADASFVTTCDAPLIVPKLVWHMASLLEEFDAVVPSIGGQLYPLTAVYRPQVAKLANSRIAAGKLRVIDFVSQLNARLVEDELRSIDGDLLSLRNCNTQEEYRELLAYGVASS